jgi:hypothetical protein
VKKGEMKKAVMIIGILLGILYVLPASMAEEPIKYEFDKCGISSSAVSISIKQDGDVLPVYEFSVTNFHNVPVRSFSIGYSPKGGLEPGFPEKNVPIQVVAPEGWFGPPNYRVYEGAQFTVYTRMADYRNNNHKEYHIKPGDTLTSLKLLLLEPLDYLLTAPFQVTFEGFDQCAYGKLVLEK